MSDSSQYPGHAIQTSDLLRDNLDIDKLRKFRARIVFAGAAHLDRVGWLDEAGNLRRSNPGKLEEFIGGAAFNAASIASTFGVSTTLLTVLGDDFSASMIQKHAASRKIDLHAQISLKVATGTYTSIMEPSGDLIIALADMAIYDEFCLPENFNDIVGSENCDFLCIDANLPPQQISALIKNTPCPVAALTVSAAKALRLQDSLKNIDLLFTNRAEAVALGGLEKTETTERAARRLQQMGVNKAVVSDSSDDVWIVEGKEVYNLPVPSMTGMIDVTGAGDALAGATLAGLAGGTPLNIAVDLGIQAAQKVLEVAGPYRKDLAETLAIERGECV